MQLRATRHFNQPPRRRIPARIQKITNSLKQ
jgi:hypothetical protein